MNPEGACSRSIEYLRFLPGGGVPLAAGAPRAEVVRLRPQLLFRFLFLLRKCRAFGTAVERASTAKTHDLFHGFLGFEDRLHHTQMNAELIGDDGVHNRQHHLHLKNVAR